MSDRHLASGSRQARIAAQGASTDAPGRPDAGETGAIEGHVGPDAVMARAGTENFPVAMRLLPAATRGHLRSVYGYARLVDNLGDEYPGDRAAALDWVQAQLDGLFAGRPRHPVFVRLAPAVERFGLSRTPFDRLLAANRLDQHKTSYADWNDLIRYCELSANPVGHLVLAVFEADTPDRMAASDAVCSGLQVVEHLQDVGEDARAGRVYLPAEDMERFGVAAGDLLAATAGPGLRGLVAFEAGRARTMLAEGLGLVASLRGPARLAVSGFVAGGLAGLDAIAAGGFDVLGGLLKAGKLRFARRLVPVVLHRAPRGLPESPPASGSAPPPAMTLPASPSATAPPESPPVSRSASPPAMTLPASPSATMLPASPPATMPPPPAATPPASPPGRAGVS